ncbi:MAG TPA: polyprenyl synthetase family protein [Fimbriimonadaceae bacterium]
MSFTAVPGSLNASSLEELATEISAVELELTRQVRSEVKLVGAIGSHVLEAGGKRLRPAFVTLAAKATGQAFDSARAHKLAACMEMIHMATLIHDDVIDNADTRRGRPTASAVFGNTASILSGDVLLSKAMSILAIDGDLEIIRTVSSAVVELAEGEVRELESRDRFDLDEDEHFEILRMKTASFIQCCCEVGARLANASDAERDALGAYGHNVGLAFQVVDDLLDYAGEATGKPLGTDFKEGCATLPLIYLQPHLTSKERESVSQKFGKAATNEEIKLLCQWMESRGALEQAKNTAQRHIDKAKESLQVLPDSPSRALLEAAADFVVSRTS